MADLPVSVNIPGIMKKNTNSGGTTLEVRNTYFSYTFEKPGMDVEFKKNILK